MTARPLGRLEVIKTEDLAVVSRDIGTLPAGYFRDPAAVVGRIAQRTLGAGEVVLPGNVRAPALIHHGQTVTLIARSGGFSVRSSGVALSDGGISERIAVRNTSSGRQVEGIVRSADTVEVSLE